ncbi:DnaJ C-terminal domain-containing protein [Pseudorhodoferax sp. Leaf274]|uniref:DnaJ C-terminal domain-containing protein n=1 Tax=Pseudorhodoferax sp. Leaf274 TaxID=1736318 RepID=UPI00070376EB|nr:DnaJ C-terminal domain-containing protein [Pseudorhodoferax sp. Leaf274]KQP37961.1 cytochrome C biogenesis protein [Pseudorhodoferax sp. Leaf274]
MDFKDYYSALGVARTASDDEVRKSYRKLARKYHPDVSKEADAEQRMREVNEAYDVLRDKDKRAAYDALAERVASGQAGPHAGAGGQGFTPPPGWDQGFDFQRSGGGPADDADFSDFFSSLFGAAQRRQAGQRQARMRGEDQHAAIEIDVATAFRGGERTLQLRALEMDAQGEPQFVQRTLQVRIPAGVRPGQYIRLAGQGLPGHGGEPAGDLFLEVRIAPDARYRVEGNDLTMRLPVTPSEAALGAQVRVPLPAGGEVEVSVPPNSRGGRRLRLKERGFAAKPPGHLYLELEIALPPADSAAARAAYEALAQAGTGFDPRAHLATAGA